MRRTTGECCLCDSWLACPANPKGIDPHGRPIDAFDMKTALLLGYALGTVGAALCKTHQEGLLKFKMDMAAKKASAS